jgi:peptidoglycan hydrolase-like protein with peptidoglycan-binding domain
MSAEGERETAAAEFQDHLRSLEQLAASIAATDLRLAAIREAIHGLGCRSVAQALEGTYACDDSIAPHPSDAPTAGAAGLLPWVLVVAVVTVPILYILLGSAKPPATDNRLPDVRSISLEPMTTAIAPLENERALPDVPDSGSGLRQPERSTVAPPQEATTGMAIRSTLPSEDDPFPVAPLAALLRPPIATPDTVDTTTTLPTPLLDLAQVEDAKRVQRRLIDLGFLFGTADGNWGPRSRGALRDFRGAQGLGTQGLGTQALGTQALGTQALGTQALGTQALGNSDTWDEKTQQDLFSAAAARAPATGTFVGGWGINVDQCRQALDNRSSLRINTRRAEAFSTTCQFNSTQRESANEWRIRASCADEHDRWNANIRLTLAGSRLTWTSERGTATYLRCPVSSN